MDVILIKTKKNTLSMKILFITSTRIGDAILSTCLLRHLETVHPKARFTIACGALSAPLFEDFERVDRLISLTSKKYGKHWVEIWAKSIGIRWDLVIDLRGSALAFLVCAKKRLVWRSKKVEKHRVEQLCDLLGQEGYEVTSPQSHLWISETRLQKGRTAIPIQQVPLIAVSPLANWPGKEWPHLQMIELLKRARAEGGPFRGAKFVFFAAPNEQGRLLEFKKHFEKEELIEVGDYSHLLDVAALMRQCDFFIGNDSGLMHMAAALGLPTLGLFGPSYDVFYRPWGRKAHFLRAPESAQELIDRADGGDENLLMKNLTVQEVYGCVKDLAILYKTS